MRPISTWKVIIGMMMYYVKMYLFRYPSDSAGGVWLSMLASCEGSKSKRFLFVLMGAEALSLTGVWRSTLRAQNRELLEKPLR